MPRYIDADNAKEIYLSKSAGEQLDRVPTADVQEIRHGKFIGRSETFDCTIRKCNRCTLYTPVGNFCVNCGAKMDGEENAN